MGKVGKQRTVLGAFSLFINVMKLTSSCCGISCVHYASFPEFLSAIDKDAVWLSLPEQWTAVRDLPSSLVERLRIHCFEMANCLTVANARAADVIWLTDLVCAGLVRFSALSEDNRNISRFEVALDQGGIRIFRPHGCHASEPSASPIGSLEFLLSDTRRLRNYPNYQSLDPIKVDIRSPVEVRAVFMLELIQDIEILKPFLLLAAMPGSIFDTVVTISQRILKSGQARVLKGLLEGLKLRWVSVEKPCHVAELLGRGKALLLTASETGVPEHQFVHHAVRTAPPRTIRVTVQHGYECIGLRNHVSHDSQYRKGVRFASDFVLTWQLPEEFAKP